MQVKGDGIMALEWSNELYSTGYDEIDNDHRKIFGMVNELLDGLRNKDLDKAMADSLAFLEIHTIEHFRYEEKLMKDTRCIVCGQNKREHLQFEKKLWNFKSSFQDDGYNRGNLSEFLNFIASWITDHIQKTDIHLRSTKVQ